MLQRTIIPDVDQLRQEIEDAPWLKGTGMIVYDPPRPGMKRKTEWWAIVKVDKEITRYYRDQIKTRYGIELCQPSWNAHISIIRGEQPSADLMHLWKKYHGQKIEFEYQPFVRFTGDTAPPQGKKKRNPPGAFWFVDVRCSVLTTIRDELQLPSSWNQHLTVGRKW